MRTGSPFLVLALTTKDSATTVTSWNPACIRSCWICWDTAMFWLVLADGCEAVGELDGGFCANAGWASAMAAVAEIAIRSFI